MNKIASTFLAARDRWSSFRNSTTGQVVLRVARWTLTLAVVALLLYQLTRIGWDEVLANLPTNPLFYVFLTCSYLTLPIVESFIYGKIWTTPCRKILPAAIKKKIFNQEVVGYSGDLFLYSWAKRKIDRTGREIAHSIKDNLIISSLTSTALAFLLLGVYAYAGKISVSGLIGEGTVGAILFFSMLSLLVISVLLVVFRRSVLYLGKRVIRFLFVMHSGRLLLTQVFSVLQWNAVLPEVAITTWFTYLAIQIVLSRVPFLPNKDLFFMGAGIELSRLVEIPEAQIAGMLLVASGLEKLVNLSLFGLISYNDRKEGRFEESVEDADPMEYFDA